MFAKKEGASFVAVSETNPKRGEKALSLELQISIMMLKMRICLMRLCLILMVDLI